MLSKGNIRMKIPTFSLPAIKTCKNSNELCRKYCYARKSEKRFKTVVESRKRNLKESKRLGFARKMIKEIKGIKNQYIRIHESGDFYSQWYLNKWFKICRENPNKVFLVYTQMSNLNWKKKPDNLIVYWTSWGNSTPDGLRAFVIDDGRGIVKPYDIPMNAKICKKGEKGLTCDKCLYCFKGKGDVIFKLH